MIFVIEMKAYHLNAELTRACNLRCDYCFNDSGTRAPNELSAQDWQTVITKTGVSSALFTGGEVMSRKDAPEIIEYAIERGVESSILTNGYRIDENYQKLLQKLRRVQISLDSATPDIHDLRRGSRSWQVARTAIDYVRGSNVPVEISSTIDAQNIDQLDGLAAIARQTESKLLLRPMQAIGRSISAAALPEEIAQRYTDIIVPDFAHYVPISGPGHDKNALAKGVLTVLPDGMIRGLRQDIRELQKLNRA